jgi:hypothetical protein
MIDLCAMCLFIICLFVLYVFVGIAFTATITNHSGPFGYKFYHWFRHTIKGRLIFVLMSMIWPVVAVTMLMVCFAAILFFGPYWLYRWIRYGEKL